MKIDKKVDAKGLSCPMPIVEVVAAMKTMKTGEILEVSATDPAFCLDMETWVKKVGYSLLETKEEGDVIIAYIQKT